MVRGESSDGGEAGEEVYIDSAHLSVYLSCEARSDSRQSGFTANPITRNMIGNTGAGGRGGGVLASELRCLRRLATFNLRRRRRHRSNRKQSSL